MSWHQTEIEFGAKSIGTEIGNIITQSRVVNIRVKICFDLDKIRTVLPITHLIQNIQLFLMVGRLNL